MLYYFSCCVIKSQYFTDIILLIHAAYDILYILVSISIVIHINSFADLVEVAGNIFIKAI